MHWECGILHRNMKKREWGTQPRAPDNGNSTSCSGYLAPGTGHWEPYTGHPDLAPTTENRASSTKHWELGTGNWERGTSFTANVASSTGHLAPGIGTGNQALCRQTWHPVPGAGHSAQGIWHWERGILYWTPSTGNPTKVAHYQEPNTRNLALDTVHQELGTWEHSPCVCTGNWALGSHTGHWDSGTGQQDLCTRNWAPSTGH